MINAATLRHRVDISNRLPLGNQFGEQTKDYEIVVPKWPCRIKHNGGSYTDDEGVSVGTTHVEMHGRYRDVTKGMYAEVRGKMMLIVDAYPNFDLSELTVICADEDDRL